MRTVRVASAVAVDALYAVVTTVHVPLRSVTVQVKRREAFLPLRAGMRVSVQRGRAVRVVPVVVRAA